MQGGGYTDGLSGSNESIACGNVQGSSRPDARAWNAHGHVPDGVRRFGRRTRRVSGRFRHGSRVAARNHISHTLIPMHGMFAAFQKVSTISIETTPTLTIRPAETAALYMLMCAQRVGFARRPGPPARRWHPLFGVQQTAAVRGKLEVGAPRLLGNRAQRRLTMLAPMRSLDRYNSSCSVPWSGTAKIKQGADMMDIRCAHVHPAAAVLHGCICMHAGAQSRWPGCDNASSIAVNAASLASPGSCHAAA